MSQRGGEYVVDVRLRGPLSVGAHIPIRLDETGAVVPAPRRPFDVVGAAAAAALGVLTLGGLVLGGIWAAVRMSLARANLARWEREWEQVEPRWSGRAQR